MKCLPGLPPRACVHRAAGSLLNATPLLRPSHHTEEQNPAFPPRLPLGPRSFPLRLPNVLQSQPLCYFLKGSNTFPPQGPGLLHRQEQKRSLYTQGGVPAQMYPPPAPARPASPDRSSKAVPQEELPVLALYPLSYFIFLQSIYYLTLHNFLKDFTPLLSASPTIKP